MNVSCADIATVTAAASPATTQTALVQFVNNKVLSCHLTSVLYR